MIEATLLRFVVEMAENPDLEALIQKTISLYSEIKPEKPPLQHDYLKKPPFRYCVDLFLYSMKATGFAPNFYTQEELACGKSPVC